MRIEMSALNVKNFSYYAFNPKAPSLSERNRKIVILAHVLLGLTLGLGHAVSAIIYAVRFHAFEAGLLKHVNTVNSTNRIALAGLKCGNLADFEIIDNLQSDPDQYICQFLGSGSCLRTINLQEAELKKIIQDKSEFITDPHHFLDDAKFEINASSKIQRGTFSTYEKVNVLAIDNSHTPPLYTCEIFDKDGITNVANLTEGLLKKIIQDKTVFIEDFNNFLNNVQFHIDSSSRVYEFPIPSIAGLDFPKIDYITVTGGTDYDCRCTVINKNGQEENITLPNEALEEITQNNLAKVENTFRYWNTPRQKQVDKIQHMTGLNLAIIDKITMTGTQECYPPCHVCKITYSNGRIERITLKDEELTKIAELNLERLEIHSQL
jgi:hypothetical protein